VASLDVPLTYQWTASCPTLASSGAFGAPGNTAAVSWTAPENLTNVQHVCTLSVTVDDGFGHTASGTVTVRVDPKPHAITLTNGPGGAPNPVQSAGAPIRGRHRARAWWAAAPSRQTPRRPRRRGRRLRT
jgi:hypothetical protein